MSDTPQNDSVESNIDNQQIETNNSVVESETTAPVEGELNQQVDEEAVAKKKANEAFNKQYGEKKQLERNLEAEKAKVAEFEQKYRDQLAAQVGEIPPMPDAFEDDYDEKVKQRDQALIAQANFNTQNQLFQKQQQFNQQQAAIAQQQEQEKLGQSFLSNAKKAGATDEEFNSIVNTLNTGGMTADLGVAIMSDPDGFFIAKHLAANPMEAHEINTMNPILAGAKFAEIKAKAIALKPKTSNTPKPGDNLQGKGGEPSKHPALEGVTYS